jgi:hypothetical protein
MLSQRPYLYNVFLDGRLELSNNRAERSIKPFVIGRNYVYTKFMCCGRRRIIKGIASRTQVST